MWKVILLVTMASNYVGSTTPHYNEQNFKVGIEYEGSLPMHGGSDRYKHKNNYEPFFVSVSTSARKDFVLTYLEVKATVDYGGDIEFSVIRGDTGSKTIYFQLISNRSDFLSFSYLAYGLREDKYNKLANVISLPITNYGSRHHLSAVTFVLFIVLISFLEFINGFVPN